MPTAKIDGVIEAVRYLPDGSIACVRAYQRRGSVWSDIQLLDRTQLLDLLRDGRKYHAGQRRRYRGGEFDITDALRRDGRFILSGTASQERDHLEGVPVF